MLPDRQTQLNTATLEWVEEASQSCFFLFLVTMEL